MIDDFKTIIDESRVTLQLMPSITIVSTIVIFLQYRPQVPGSALRNLVAFAFLGEMTHIETMLI
jgi:hypothetical protein